MFQTVGRIGQIGIQTRVLVEDGVIGPTVRTARCGRGFGDSSRFTSARIENHTSVSSIIRTHRDGEWQLLDTWLKRSGLPVATREFFGWGHLLELNSKNANWRLIWNYPPISASHRLESGAAPGKKGGWRLASKPQAG